MSINIEDLKKQAVDNCKICLLINDDCKLAHLLEDIKGYEPQEFKEKPINYKSIDKTV